MKTKLADISQALNNFKKEHNRIPTVDSNVLFVKYFYSVKFCKHTLGFMRVQCCPQQYSGTSAKFNSEASVLWFSDNWLQILFA